MSGGLNQAYWSLIQKRAHVGGVSLGVKVDRPRDQHEAEQLVLWLTTPGLKEKGKKDAQAGTGSCLKVNTKPAKWSQHFLVAVGGAEFQL